MTNIIDASQIDLEGRNVLFDTNIWILIHGFGYHPRPLKTEIYSAAYKQLLSRSNTVVVNDYVISEFCSRCTKIEYDALKKRVDNPEAFPPYKQFRQGQEFQANMETVRDTCLNIIDDCEYIAVSASKAEIANALQHFCTGKIDFSDSILTSFCKAKNLYLMTDDHDFHDQEIDIITANNRILRGR